MEQRSEIEFKIQKGRIRDLSAGKKFAIMRTSKIKSMGNMAASLSHTFRERPTPNADFERTPSNTILVGPDTADAVVEAWRSAAPVKQRKNAVLAVEYLVTGSPEAMKELSTDNQDQYFKDALLWLQEKHGSENILSAVIHRDETTPHLSAMVIPLVEGKLNAKHFLGGRGKLTAMQTNFAQNVGAEYGLERGVERSGATHQRVSQHYAAIQEGPRDAVSLPERQKGNILGVGRETDDEWLGRLSGIVSGIVWEHRVVADDAVTRAATAESNDRNTRRKADRLVTKSENLEQTIESLRREVQEANAFADQQKTAMDNIIKAANRSGVLDQVQQGLDSMHEEKKVREQAQQQKLERERIDQQKLQQEQASLKRMQSTVNIIRNFRTVVFDNKGDELDYLKTFKATFGENGIDRMANGDLSVLKDLAAKEREQRTIAHVTLRLFKRNPEMGIDQNTIERGMSLHDPKGHDLGGHSI